MPQVCNFIKKEALAQVFSCEFCKISKNTFSYRTPPVAASENTFPLPSSVYLRDNMDGNISNFILLVK